MQLKVDVCKKFGDFECSVDFTLNNERCGVFGPSGSGKSTLMNMLAGLLTPDKGLISLNDRVLFDSENSINISSQKRRVGVVFQDALLFPHMNVRKNLFYGAVRSGRDGKKIDPEQLISVLHLEPLLERGVEKLSGGERQRVALGRTILASPDLILLDEPLNGLDRGLKFQIIPHLRSVFSEFAIPHALYQPLHSRDADDDRYRACHGERLGCGADVHR